jgi:hypothetical protein
MASESSGAFFADICKRKSGPEEFPEIQLILIGKLGVPGAARRFPLDWQVGAPAEEFSLKPAYGVVIPPL